MKRELDLKKKYQIRSDQKRRETTDLRKEKEREKNHQNYPFSYLFPPSSLSPTTMHPLLSWPLLFANSAPISFFIFLFFPQPIHSISLSPPSAPPSLHAAIPLPFRLLLNPFDKTTTTTTININNPTLSISDSTSVEREEEPDTPDVLGIFSCSNVKASNQ